MNRRLCWLVVAAVLAACVAAHAVCPLIVGRALAVEATG
jgi:hypothetical protein